MSGAPDTERPSPTDVEGGEVISTDYLVVGAGASGLAFADTLVTEEPDVELTLVDRRPGPGGHWLDAYPFVRLHTPSAYYGVNSLPLGEDRIDRSGENAGFYERATGAEVRDYFAEVASRLTQTGRVRILTRHEHLGPGEHGEQVRDLSTGAVHDVEVRRKLVDARYLEASIPATHEPSFNVARGARVVPVNELPAAARSGTRYLVLGSGKTAVDACTWLLDNDVAPTRIRWVRPRDHWFHHRRHFQPRLPERGPPRRRRRHDRLRRLRWRHRWQDIDPGDHELDVLQRRPDPHRPFRRLRAPTRASTTRLARLARRPSMA